MPIDRVRGSELLKSFEFRRIFIDHLGWDKYSRTLRHVIDGHDYDFQAIAEKRGVVFLVCNSIPDSGTRLKLDRAIAQDYFQHLIVFADNQSEKQLWQWVRYESGKPLSVRTQSFESSQTGELLLQKLDHLVVSLEEEDQIAHGHVTGRLQAGFDVERITRRFYESFKTEHDKYLKFLNGVPDDLAPWYASVMINRLMFLYFLQAKGFLDRDTDYLRNKLKESRDRKQDAYYREFLCPLFFEGFACKRAERSASVNQLLGDIPYLNGGLFQKHQIEELYGKKILIPDIAFQRLIDFFKTYDWHLDDRPNRADNEINPDVLGYIFEKYINQKQMGAYYTKEDITEYISQNTIIPFILDAARKDFTIPFDEDGSVWRLLRDNPKRYIHNAVRHGVDVPLPPEIAVGLTDVNQRSGWNKPAPSEFALPTETWREVVDRRRHCEDLLKTLSSGWVHEVNDLITLNLNIRQFAQDVIQYGEAPELVRALYKATSTVSVLDPTCGSGAFLFAALNILKPLYEACLQRMQTFVDELEASPSKNSQKFKDFRQVLNESLRHPKQDYFILKQIIVDNLYGVDIMEEAAEICKLRLFLKLVAQVEPGQAIEPLPDIDFNIRTGNTLVGYTRLSEVGRGQANLYLEEQRAKIEDQAETIDAALSEFRLQQTRLNGTVTPEDKQQLRRRLNELEGELNDFLAAEYGIKKSGIGAWKRTHKPFHWFSEFHGIMGDGGFDVVIGNPPYVELRQITDYQIRGYTCSTAGNLYAVMLERCVALGSKVARLGFIVPVSSVSTDRYAPLQALLRKRIFAAYSSYDDRPSRLFDGLEHIRLTIHLFLNTEGTHSRLFSSRYNKWFSDYRGHLFSTLVFHEAQPALIPATLPKLCSKLEASIIAKLASQRTQVGLASVARAQHPVFYSRKVGYFLQVLNFEPVVLDGRGAQRPPSEFKTLFFDSKKAADAVLCALNASLFYWFITVFSDCRHVNKREVESFPLDVRAITANGASTELARLGRRLMNDLKQNSKRRTMRFAHDTLTVQCIYPRHSKQIIDEIDRVLASHYGLTNEELDFIVNYDIKYRLGADAGDEE